MTEEEMLKLSETIYEISSALKSAFSVILSKYDDEDVHSVTVMPAIISFLASAIKNFDKEGRKDIFDSLVVSLKLLESTILSHENEEENVSGTIN